MRLPSDGDVHREHTEAGESLTSGENCIASNKHLQQEGLTCLWTGVYVFMGLDGRPSSHQGKSIFQPSVYVYWAQ